MLWITALVTQDGVSQEKEGGLRSVAHEAGTVKWFNGEKGYGFIRPDEGGEDLFVHHTGIAGTGFKYLVEGERVTFEAYPARWGVEVRNVSKL